MWVGLRILKIIVMILKIWIYKLFNVFWRIRVWK